MKVFIADAKRIARERKQRQVIIVAWDGESTHVTTYGRSLTDCEQVAIGGNKVKAAIGWPDYMCHAKPSRVRELEREVRRLQSDAIAIRADLRACQRACALAQSQLE